MARGIFESPIVGIVNKLFVGLIDAPVVGQVRSSSSLQTGNNCWQRSEGSVGTRPDEVGCPQLTHLNQSITIGSDFH